MLPPPHSILTAALALSPWIVTRISAAPTLNTTQDAQSLDDQDGLTRGGWPLIPVPFSITSKIGNTPIDINSAYDVSLDALATISKFDAGGTIGQTSFHHGFVKMQVSAIHDLDPVEVIDVAYGIWKAIDYYRETNQFYEGDFELRFHARRLVKISYRSIRAVDQAAGQNSSQTEAELDSIVGGGLKMASNETELDSPLPKTLVQTPSWFGRPLPPWAWYMPLNTAIVAIMKTPKDRRAAMIEQFDLTKNMPSYNFYVNDFSAPLDRNHLTRNFVLAMCRSAWKTGRQKQNKEEFKLKFAFVDDQQKQSILWQLTLRRPLASDQISGGDESGGMLDGNNSSVLPTLPTAQLPASQIVQVT